MINLTTISRPYAKAVLEIAQHDGSYKEWSRMLGFLSLVVKDEEANKLLANLAVAPKTKAEFLCALLPQDVDVRVKNLIWLLAQAKRLLIIPALFNLYEVMRRKAESIVQINIRVAQAVPISDLQAELVKTSFGTTELSESVDAKLIGGGVVEIGDRVIDGSIHGRLQALRDLLVRN